MVHELQACIVMMRWVHAYVMMRWVHLFRLARLGIEAKQLVELHGRPWAQGRESTTRQQGVDASLWKQAANRPACSLHQHTSITSTGSATQRLTSTKRRAAAASC